MYTLSQFHKSTLLSRKMSLQLLKSTFLTKEILPQLHFDAHNTIVALWI